MSRRVWSVILTLCLLAGMSPPWARAAVVDSGTCGDNVTWSLDDAGTFTISGSGPMANSFYVLGVGRNIITSITTVIIGNGVTSISSSAFAECSTLTSVTIPNTVTSIGSSAFAECSALTSVTIPDSVTYIGESAFNGCSGLISLTISNSVTRLDYNTFDGCSGLTSVTIPNSVTYISEGAFGGCSGLTSVTIPNSVTFLHPYAFGGCSNLISVNVESENTQYSSENGIIFNKDKTLLLYYPSGKPETTYTIPNGVTRIDSYAFRGCNRLTSVTIPNGVTKIDYYAFGDCSGLTSVTVPDSVTSISQYAFNGCNQLNDVYYSGTQAQWKAINIDIDNESNASLVNATIHCTDGILSGSTENNTIFAISPDSLTLALGQTRELTTTTNDASTIWSVANPNVAALSATTGNTVTVTAIGPGRTDVAADNGTGMVAVCPVTVSGVAISPAALNLDRNANGSLTLYTYGDTVYVPANDWQWSIQPESDVATIDASGLTCNVQAVGLGEAVITCGNGVYAATCELTVGESEIEPAEVTPSPTTLTEVTLSPTTLTLSQGGTGTVQAITSAQASEIIWNISDPNVAAIFTTNGNAATIAGVTAGETVLTAQVGGGTVAQCRIIVSGAQTNPTPDPVPSQNPESVTPNDSGASYLVEFDENGGGGFMNSVSVSGSVYTLPENGFTPPYGMLFRAWRVEDESGNRYEYYPNATIPVSSDLTVTALWEKDSSALAQGYCGAENGGVNLTWTLSRDWNLTVSGTGDMASYDADNRAPWYGYHTNIQTVSLQSGVTSVGSHAFTYCAALETVTFPDTLAIIGDSAFLNCAALTSVTLPSGLRALGDRAFCGCESLTRATLPATLSDTGNYTFENCAALRNVTLPAGLSRVGYYAFYNCGVSSVTLPEGLRTLDIGAFSDCRSLRQIVFPETLTNINDRVFEGCTAFGRRSRTDAQYQGTVAEFAAIAQTLGSGNDPLKAQVVHCIDDDYDWTPPDRYRILEKLSDMDEFTDQVWHLAGPLSEFQTLSIDDTPLMRASVLTRTGRDYTAEEGSTKLNIPAETFQSFDRGSHTIAADFFNATDGISTRDQIYTVFPPRGTARIDTRDMLGVTGVENVAYGGFFRSDPVLQDGLFRFHVVSGEVPPGLTLRDGGYFTGVARTAGTYSFTVGLQLKRDKEDWPSTDEDVVSVTITIEPGTEVKVEAASDPGYEIIVPIPDQIVETTMDPDEFELVSQGPFEEFYELYVDGKLIPREDYTVRPYNLNGGGNPGLLDAGGVTGTYLSSKNIKLSAGTHPVNLTFQHKDPLGNTEIKKSTQTVNVTQRIPYSSGGGSSSGSGSTLYTISKATTANGLITLSNASAKAGSQVTITATPAAGYSVGSVTVVGSNKQSVPVTGGNGSYTFTMPTRRVTVSATFTRPTSPATVTESPHGAVSLSASAAAPGDTVTVSTTPDKGYLLLGVIVRGADGAQLPVRAIGNGSYTFSMPSGGVTASANFTPKHLGTFTDILGPYWFFDDAEWAYNRGILRGVTDEYWEPETKISGVTSIVTLERLDGVDLTPYDTGAFDGLDNSKWYVSAIRWARANGICDPYRTFSEYEPLTRGEYAVMLCKFLQYRGLNVSASANIAYADAWTLTEAERQAFQFLQYAGVFNGFEDGTIRPSSLLNRAQLAALLHRLSQYIIRTETLAF